MKNKTTAGLLAFFLGGLGVHRFYLNQTGLGILYLVFCWTGIPLIVGVIDGIIFLTTDEIKFNQKYKLIPPSYERPIYVPTNTIDIQQPILNIEPFDNEKTLNIELNAVEKLQFKKFISEQGGLAGTDVDNYISSIDEDEKIDLIKTFRKEKQQEIQRQQIQIQPTATPTIKTVVENNHLPSCPKCKSKQVTFNKKGFSTGKALTGAVLTGGIGLLAGGIGKNKIILTCLKCGHTWKRG